MVPNPVETPGRLAMQSSLGRFDVSREAVLGDALRFGFDDRAAAGQYLDALLDRIEAAFEDGCASLDADSRDVLGRRMAGQVAVLRATV